MGEFRDVTFTMPTEWFGADYEEERTYWLSEFETPQELEQTIEEDFAEWVENILEDLRMSAEWHYNND